MCRPYTITFTQLLFLVSSFCSNLIYDNCGDRHSILMNDEYMHQHLHPLV